MSPLSSLVRRAVLGAGIRLPGRLMRCLPDRVENRVASARSEREDRRHRPPEAIPSSDNVGYNRLVWDWYAERWSDRDFRKRQLTYEGRGDEDPDALLLLGDEWGRPADVQAIIDRWILPHIGPAAVVGEIGTGGGRVASRVAPASGQFHAFDISPKLLAIVRNKLAHVAGAEFHLLDGPRLPAAMSGAFDFIYSFDVFVHLDLHVQWRYLAEVARSLRPGGRAFLHTANLATTAGWERFVAQERYRVEGFYFVTPEIVKTMLGHAGLRVVDEVTGESGNFYYARDYLAVVEKAPDG